MRIGIIGHGSIGKRHHKNLTDMNHICVYHDPAFDKSSPLDEVFMSADAFVIASPTSSHYEHLFISERPMLVEKPIAATAAEASRIHRLGHELYDRIFVGYNLRFLRTVQKTKEVLDEGRIKPLWARFTCSQFNDKPAYLRDGVILNWSHEIDLALYLLGPAKLKASNTVLRDGQDVLTDIILEHASGITSVVHLDYLKEPQVRGFSIVGEDSNIMCDIDEGLFLHERPWSKDMMMEGDFDDCYVREMEQFIKFCETGNHGAGCTAQEALQVLDICLKVRQQAGLEV